MTRKRGRKKPKDARLNALCNPSAKNRFYVHSLGIHVYAVRFTHVLSIEPDFDRDERKLQKTAISCKTSRDRNVKQTATNARHKVECTLTFKPRVSTSRSPHAKYEKIV